MEAWFSRERLLLGIGLTGVSGLELDGRDVADLAVDAYVVEPPDPVELGEFQVVNATPGSFVSDALGPVMRLRALEWGV